RGGGIAADGEGFRGVVVIPLQLREDADATGGRVVGDPARVVHVVTTDSCTATDASLFVALATRSADGHDFVDAARAAGALAVLVEQDRVAMDGDAVVVEDTWAALAALAGEVRRRVAPTSVAITGSVGKTTVKD